MTMIRGMHEKFSCFITLFYLQWLSHWRVNSVMVSMGFIQVIKTPFQHHVNLIKYHPNTLFH